MLTPTLVLFPLKAVCSLIAGNANSSRKFGTVKITLASPELKRPPKSWNFNTYSPAFAGTIASVLLPLNASIKSVEFKKH